MLATLLNEGSGLFIRNDFMPYRQSFVPVLDYAGPVSICALRTHACKMQVVEQRNLEFAVSYIVTLVTRKFTRIWSTNFPPNTTEH
jgi:hypothetical protein